MSDPVPIVILVVGLSFCSLSLSLRLLHYLARVEYLLDNNEVFMSDAPQPSSAPFVAHPAMSPHGLMTPANGFASILGAIGAKSAVSLGIQVLGFLSQRPDFFPSNGAAWAALCGTAANLLASFAGTATQAVPSPARNLP